MFLGLSDDDWYSLGTMLLGIGAVTAGFWALFSYYKSRRQEAARWLQGVFKDFYLAPTFNEVRRILEYDFAQRAGPLLERRITDRHVPVTADDIAVLEGLDNLLNYFEHVLYLERERHIRRRDREAVFEYWFGIMSSPERASLRRYVARFGYERVAAAVRARDPEYLAVYGSLRAGMGLPDLPTELAPMLADRGRCVISGQLYALGEYPGLVLRDGEVRGQLYEVTDMNAFSLMDGYERYDPADRDSSLYLRCCVRLVEPEVDAWIYVYNQKLGDAPRIGSGDWAEYVATDRPRPALS